jgi:hypothetical protein
MEVGGDWFLEDAEALTRADAYGEDGGAAQHGNPETAFSRHAGPPSVVMLLA